MKEIVQRLQEKRNIEVAKSILEDQGYKVSKRLKESADNIPHGFKKDNYGSYVSPTYEFDGEGETYYVHLILDPEENKLKCVYETDFTGDSVSFQYDTYEDSVSAAEENLDKLKSCDGMQWSEVELPLYYDAEGY